MCGSACRVRTYPSRGTLTSGKTRLTPRAAEIREALALFGGLRENGAEIRLHLAVLYNSIYRADNQLLVSQHIYGIASELQPVIYLRSVAPGDMTSSYLDVFERVWASALRAE